MVRAAGASSNHLRQFLEALHDMGKLLKYLHYWAVSQSKIIFFCEFYYIQ